MFRMFWGDWMPSAFGFDAWAHRSAKEDHYHNTATVSQMSANLTNAKVEPKGKNQNEQGAEAEDERLRREQSLLTNGKNRLSGERDHQRNSGVWLQKTEERRGSSSYIVGFGTGRPIVLSQQPTCSLQYRHCIYAVQQLFSLGLSPHCLADSPGCCLWHQLSLTSWPFTLSLAICSVTHKHHRDDTPKYFHF